MYVSLFYIYVVYLNNILQEAVLWVVYTGQYIHIISHCSCFTKQIYYSAIFSLKVIVLLHSWPLFVF